MLTIYKASAGSGKTYTLAYDYIRTLLTLKHPDGRYVLNGSGGRRYSHRHRGILAITFTNAATEEMKQRITMRLNDLAHMDDDGNKADGKKADYAEDIRILTGCSFRALADAAQSALAELLTDYSHFNVSTIDSFFQSVLHTFAREIDHQGDYELAIDNSDVIRQSLSMMLDDVNYTDSETSRRIEAWLRAYMTERLLEGEKFNAFDRNGRVLANLGDALNEALNEVFYRYADRVTEYLAEPARPETFRKYLAGRRKCIKDNLTATSRRYIQLIDNALPKGYNSNFYKLACKLADGAVPESKAAWYLDARYNGAKADASQFINSEPLKKLLKTNPGAVVDIAEAGNSLINAYVEHETLYTLFSDMQAAVGELQFIGHASQYLERYLRDNNMMLISDSGELLNRIIGDAEIPFIYERTGTRLTNLLIDEFQDTSMLQWQNLRPLVDNAIAGGNDCLIIGDVKQAIYRFRNSDPTLLGHTVPDIDFKNRHNARGITPADNENHRSSPGIIQFNNTVFERIGNLCRVPGYDNVRQQIWNRHGGEEAYIRVEMSKKPPGEIYDEIAGSMRRQHQDGYMWRDIAVLVRTNNDAKKLIEYFLAHHPDIRILSNEALLLINSPAVRMIMSILRLVERAYINTGAGGDGKGRYADRDDIELMMSTFDYRLGSGDDIAAALADALDTVGGDNSVLIEEIRAIKNRNSANLVALIENIIALKIPEEMRASQQAYIAALQDRAIEHVAGPDASTGAFIDSFAANREKWAIQAPASQDAVQVMTIHKAKGLGRPCVYMPDANLPLYGKKPWKGWVPVAELPAFADVSSTPPLLLLGISPKALDKPDFNSPIKAFIEERARESREDTINNAYVAFTRAERELIVYINPSGETPSFGKLLASVMKTPFDGDSSGLTIDTAAFVSDNEDGTVFEYGSFTTPRQSGNGADDTIGVPTYKAVSHNSTRSLTAIDDILADDIDTGDEAVDIDDDEPYTNAAMRAAARRGTALHAVLAEMRTTDDMDSALHSVCTRMALDDSERAAMKADLTRAFEAAPLATSLWFSPGTKVYSERAIYDAGHDKIYRPDRAMELPDGTAVVVDYKFTSRERPGHRRQVARYASLISQIDNRRTEAYLWYPLLSKIIKV